MGETDTKTKGKNLRVANQIYYNSSPGRRSIYVQIKIAYVVTSGLDVFIAPLHIMLQQKVLWAKHVYLSQRETQD